MPLEWLLLSFIIEKQGGYSQITTGQYVFYGDKKGLLIIAHGKISPSGI